MKILRKRMTMWGFSGEKGILVTVHIRKESMPIRDVSYEDLMACLLFGQLTEIFPGRYRNEKKFKVIGKDLSGDELAVILLVRINSDNPEKWIFKLITVFQINQKEAGKPASALLKLFVFKRL